jgi:flagellar motor switch protein FliM
MSQLLTQELVGGLLRKARGSASAVKGGPQAQKASPVDLRGSRQFSPSQTRSLTVLQEAYARRIGDALNAYLRASFEIKVGAVEQLVYSDFLGRFSGPAYVASFCIPPLDTTGLICLQLPLVFQMLDFLLGGFGKADAGTRDLTEIEEEIFKSVTQILCQELRGAWRPVVDVDFRFAKRQREIRSAGLMPASEKVLLLSFNFVAGESKAAMTLAFPSAFATPLLRELSAQTSAPEPVSSPQNRARIQELLLDSRFDAELVLPPGKISVGEVFRLEPGSTVVLQAGTSEPIHFNVAGKTMFLATPVRHGARRAAEILKVLSIAPEKERK